MSGVKELISKFNSSASSPQPSKGRAENGGGVSTRWVLERSASAGIKWRCACTEDAVHEVFGEELRGASVFSHLAMTDPVRVCAFGVSPVYFVSHVWANRFSVLLEALERLLEGAETEDIFVWIDFLNLQFEESKKGIGFWKKTFVDEIMAKCEKLVVVSCFLDIASFVMPLTRSWCIFEIFVFLLTHPSSKTPKSEKERSGIMFSIGMADRKALRRAIFDNINHLCLEILSPKSKLGDLSKSDSLIPGDSSMIIRAIREMSISGVRFLDVQESVLVVFRDFILSEGIEIVFTASSAEGTSRDQADFCLNLVKLLHQGNYSLAPKVEETLLRKCLELNAKFGADDSTEVKNTKALLADFLFKQERFDEALLLCTNT